MHFSQLLSHIPNLLHPPEADVEISAPISEDSRTVQRGGLFVARRGLRVDSHAFIGAAIANGAAAVVGECPSEQVRCSVPYAQVADAQQAIGHLAAAYYDFPSHALTVIGVTGTDGKTTTTNLIFNILKCAGVPVGMISTVSAVIGDEELPTGLHVTTPTAPEVQSYLRRMVQAGLTHCVLEATSHGLAQGRVNGVAFDVAVLTNVTHEHLDFHGSFENYRAAKGLLFSRLAESHRKADVPKCAVINLDDPNASYFLELTESVEQVAYSTQGYGRVNLLDWRTQPSGVRGVLLDSLQGISIAFRTPLIGLYNLQNILAAASAALALGISPEAIQRGIETLPPIPGRMERLDEGQNFTAIVDFAHTPNALEKALQAARSLTDKRVIAVFGSAGLRDVEKRRLMAEVGAQLADICVLTAEDPRTESLDAILEMMAEGARHKGGVEGVTFFRVPDRGAALAFACRLAQPGDIVIACGKGHEQSMCFGEIEYPWDDREALRAALRGTPLKTLPTANA
ncbi:MAG: UDP-N-acetylmuramoyl-L-alanyl-D-glutamate--2,6-diaminopimelate ligase [Aggregatilineales bacterium]